MASKGRIVSRQPGISHSWFRPLVLMALRPWSWNSFSQCRPKRDIFWEKGGAGGAIMFCKQPAFSGALKRQKLEVRLMKLLLLYEVHGHA